MAPFAHTWPLHHGRNPSQILALRGGLAETGARVFDLFLPKAGEYPSTTATAFTIYNDAMAWDSSETDYHLTPRGGEPGEDSIMGDPAPNHNPVVPEDRLLTMRRHTKQTSGWSAEDGW